MAKIITLITMFLCNLLAAQSSFDPEMKNAFELWKDGKNTEALKVFEKLAVTEQSNWLPDYYIALLNITAAFTEKDPTSIEVLFTKAEKALDIELAKNQENEELYVLRGVLFTAKIMADPINKGVIDYPTVLQQYAKAKKINAMNPCVILCEAEFQLEGSKWTGVETKPLCAQLDKATELFATFKPKSEFAPSWGLDRAEAARKVCK